MPDKHRFALINGSIMYETMNNFELTLLFSWASNSVWFDYHVTRVKILIEIESVVLLEI